MLDIKLLTTTLSNNNINYALRGMTIFKLLYNTETETNELIIDTDDIDNTSRLVDTLLDIDKYTINKKLNIFIEYKALNNSIIIQKVSKEALLESQQITNNINTYSLDSLFQLEVGTNMYKYTDTISYLNDILNIFLQLKEVLSESNLFNMEDIMMYDYKKDKVALELALNTNMTKENIDKFNINYNKTLTYFRS